MACSSCERGALSTDDLSEGNERQYCNTMYKYNKLRQTQSIRVIQLLPSLKEDANIIIRLLEVSLDTANYEALSYAWESQPFDQSITCEGDELLISRTCKAALLRLRRRMRPRSLWVDQICIDQTSLTEKNQQIALMGEIYNKTSRAIVWLGCGPLVDQLIKWVQLHRRLSIIRMPHGRFARWYMGPLFLPWIPVFRVLAWGIVPLFDARSQARFREKMRSQDPDLRPVEWFERMWTIQEAALPRRVIVVTSTSSMEYESFMSNLEKWLESGLSDDDTTISHPPHENEFLSYYIPAIPLINARRRIRTEIQHRIVHAGPNPYGYSGLGTILREIMPHARCSVSNDKVFAMHELLAMLGIVLPKPDYNLGSGEVYWRAISAIAEQEHSLWFLDQVNGPIWNSEFPSWVPNLNHLEFRRTWFGSLGGWDFELEHDNRILVTQPLANDRVLGRIYHEIGAMPNRDIGIQENVAELVRAHISTIHTLRSFIRATKDIETPSYDAENIIDEIVEVFGQSFERLDGHYPDNLVSLLLETLSSDRKIAEMYQNALEDGLVQTVLLRKPEFLNLSYLPEVQLLAIIVSMDLWTEYFLTWRNLVGKALIWTQNGFVGTAPWAAEVGDVVSVLGGARRPFALRPTQRNTFQVIGPASVRWLVFKKESLPVIRLE